LSPSRAYDLSSLVVRESGAKQLSWLIPHVSKNRFSGVEISYAIFKKKELPTGVRN
jgi:hypothetical protein